MKTRVLAAAVVLLTLAACAHQPAVPIADVPGFWRGLWHGVIAPIALVAGIFSDVRIYAFPNTGGWYDLGFLLGLSARRACASVIGMVFFLSAFLFCWRVGPVLGGGARSLTPLPLRERMIAGKDRRVDLADQEAPAATSAGMLTARNRATRRGQRDPQAARGQEPRPGPQRESSLRGGAPFPPFASMEGMPSFLVQTSTMGMGLSLEMLPDQLGITSFQPSFGMSSLEASRRAMPGCTTALI